MKKVVVLCFNRSGLFHYAAQLARALAASGQWEVLFITSLHNPPFLLTKSPQCRILRLNAPHQPGAFIQQLPQFFANRRQVYEAIAQFKPAVLHITDSYPWYLGWGALWARYPLVVTMHEPAPHTGERYGFVLAMLNRFLRRHARHIVVHGNLLKEYLTKKRGLATNIVTVVPHGEYGFFSQWAQGHAPRPGAILFFGRILPYKGLHVLIAAFNQLIAGGTAASLTIAGEGNVVPYLQQLTDQARSHVTIDNRYIPETEVARIFETHALVVLPYLDATQSGVIPLAFGLKRPVVASNVGAISEAVRDGVTGLLVPPNNAALLADAIKQLLADAKLRDQLAANAYQVTQKELAWPVIAEQYARVYRLVL